MMLSFYRSFLVVFGSAIVMLPGLAWSADVPTGTLTLSNGDAVNGGFRPSQNPETIRWQGTAFTRPFEFPTSVVSGVQIPPTDPPLKPEGDFAFELLAGDVIHGNPTGWSATEGLEVASPQFGRLHVQKDALRRIYRLSDNPLLVYSGPMGLSDWQTNDNQWRIDGTSLATQQDQAVLIGDLAVPDRAIFEIELSWNAKPNFVFTMAANPNDTAGRWQDGWRLETLGDDLVTLREQAEAADVDLVEASVSKSNRISLIAYLDQPAGQLHIFRQDGTPAGKITVPPAETDATPGKKPAPFGRGVRLINRNGTLRLDRLRISRWHGDLPSIQNDGNTRLELSSGKVVSGKIQGLSPDGQNLVVLQEEQETQVPLQELVVAEWPSSGTRQSRPVSIALQEGTRLSGTLTDIRETELVFTTPDIVEPVVIPQNLLRSLAVLQPGQMDHDDVPASEGRMGKLRLGNLQLTGQLMPGTEDAEASCLVWHPRGSTTSSPLRNNVAGSVTYKEVRVNAERPAARQAAQVRNAVVFPGVRLFGGQAVATAKPKQAPVKPDQPGKSHTIHLRSGDVIPCVIESINEEGVSISSPVAEVRTVPHALIKAVELQPGTAPPKLKKAKKERLLTLPRLQKASPPTHLLCSSTGDFLRCRLVDMNDERIRIELHLDELDLPRDRVAQIVWFHPDELQTAEDSDEKQEAPRNVPEVAEKPNSTISHLAQIIRNDGNRVTFDPESVNEKSIIGVSEVLGRCEFDLDEISQLVFGEQIQVAAANLVYHQWRLHPALEPLVAQDLESGPSAVGSESPLVGKKAPEIELELLAGGTFKLSENKGRIVVLDFWATWCGPCMQTMPLVEEALREFDPQQVRLVSVNLEEPANQVKSVLERQKLKVEVAMDIDGVAARKYEANAIPQLVVVDRTGKIAKLYIGGGPNMVEQLKVSLTELLTQTDATPADSKPADEQPATEKPAEQPAAEATN